MNHYQIGYNQTKGDYTHLRGKDLVDWCNGLWQRYADDWHGTTSTKHVAYETRIAKVRKLLP